VKIIFFAIGAALSFTPLAYSSNQSLSAVLFETKNEVASPLPGVVVEINGKLKAVSDALGRAYTKLPPGDHHAIAYIPGFQRGEVRFAIPESGRVSNPFEILLLESDVELRVLGLKHKGVLPAKTSALALEMRNRAGKLLPIKEVILITLEDPVRGLNVDLSDFFVFDRGRLRAHEESMRALREILAKTRERVNIRIRAKVEGHEKNIVEAEAGLWMGRYTIKGKLRDAKLQIANGERLQIRARPIHWFPGAELIWTPSLGRDGSFELIDIPFTRLEIKRHIKDENQVWAWWVESYGNTKVELRPETLASIRARQSPVNYLERSDDRRFILDGSLREVKNE
jgi:hypothetical protein